MKWADIPAAAKMTGAVIPVLAGAVIWMFTTFETASGSQQKWAEHNQAIACRTVYELQAEIRSYLKRLEFDKKLTEQDILWIRAEIESLNANIKRLDPDGRC